MEGGADEMTAPLILYLLFLNRFINNELRLNKVLATKNIALIA